VRTLSRLGKTVIISSHILPDLSTICTAFGIMERGTMRVSGTFEEVTKSLRMTARIEIGFLGGPRRVTALLERIPGAIAPKLGDRSVEFGFEGDEAEQARILKRFIDDGLEVTRFVRRECDLEEIFLQIGADKVQ
jgi:ABC-2 type transport system ATP-binding protein